jgi:hypothetical protein
MVVTNKSTKQVAQAKPVKRAASSAKKTRASYPTGGFGTAYRDSAK